MERTRIYIDNNKGPEISVADSYFLRLRGLIGRSAAELGGLMIKPCNSIHTFFMKEAIDVVYLDREGLVLRVDRVVEPSRICRSERKAKAVLELPCGMAEELMIFKGSTISAQKRFCK